MNAEEIDYLVADIMIEDGPDGHCDGHEIITGFIVALLAGKGKEWKEEYCLKKGLTDYFKDIV
jgi:hypothetical protein